MKEKLENILLINKPKGITSFDVIRILRRKLGIRKIGHAGTLDPIATGLMIVGVGDGTKKLKDFISLPKSYEAEIILGIKTSTGDLDGNIIKEDCADLSAGLKSETIKKTVEGMAGNIILPVSAYSAMKQGGESLYKKARRGDKLIIPKREMEIFKAELVDVISGNTFVTIKTRFDVGSGTYIRSIAEEIGKRLGTYASVKELRRVRVGDYNLEDAEDV